MYVKCDIILVFDYNIFVLFFPLQFVSFSQRISDINIDVIHKIKRVDDDVVRI